MRRRKGPRQPCLTRKGRILVWCGLLLALAAAVCLVTDLRLRPVMVALASSELQNKMTLRSSEIWVALEKEQGFSLENAVTFYRGEDGSIYALTADADAMNQLSAALTTQLATELSEMERETLSVPLGTALELPLVSGLGPDVTAEIVDVGHVDAEIKSDFSAAGINQTLYSITLHLSVEMLLLLPGGTELLTIESSSLLAETVLMGEVPQHYVSISGVQNASDSMAEEK